MAELEMRTAGTRAKQFRSFTVARGIDRLL
jgi:hypothetical protein